MSLESGQAQFMSLIQSFTNATSRAEFISWLRTAALPELDKLDGGTPEDLASARIKLSQISVSLQNLVPLEAVFPSEQIHFPTQGRQTDRQTDTYANASRVAA